MNKDKEVVTKTCRNLLFRINGVQNLASAAISPTERKRRELFLFGYSYYLMQGSSFTTFNTQAMVLIAQPFV